MSCVLLMRALGGALISLAEPFEQVHLQRAVAEMALTYAQLQQHLQELYHFLQALHNLGRESPQAYVCSSRSICIGFRRVESYALPRPS